MVVVKNYKNYYKTVKKNAIKISNIEIAIFSLYNVVFQGM